jgi:DNA modification methylase
VLDPFGGSGSTLIACEKAGRQARLIELDPRYGDVIARRWQEWTSEVATLDGRPFEEVAAARATPEQAER